MRESKVVPPIQAGFTRPLRSYDVTGLPPGHTVMIRELPAGGWRLLVAQPGQTMAIRGEFLTAEAALARAQLDYDSRVK